MERACADDGLVRVDYETLGNNLPIVDGHAFPRYSWEASERRAGPVWNSPRDEPYGEEHILDARHDELRAALTRELDARIASAPDAATR